MSDEKSDILNDIMDNLAISAKKAEERCKKTGEDIDDIFLSLNDKEEPVSIKEVNEKDAPIYIVCTRIKDQPIAAVIGATEEACDGCREKVWISPATLQTYDKMKKKVIMCIQCMMKNLPLTDAERKEILDEN